MKKFLILFYIILASILYFDTNYYPNRAYCYHLHNIPVRKQMQNDAEFMSIFSFETNLTGDKKADGIFYYFFDEYLEGNYREITNLPPIVQKDKNDFNDKDYEVIFGNDNGNISSKEHEDRLVLANSMLSHFGITVGELIDIRQGKKLDGRDDIKSEDVNALFNTCLKSINEKFKTQEDKKKDQKKTTEKTLEQNEIADLVVEKLIERLSREENSQLKNEIVNLVIKKLEERNNESSIPLAPTLPEQLI